MSDSTYYVYQTPLGRITLGCDGQALTRFAFGVCECEGRFAPSALTNQASTQVLEYLSGKRTAFDVPLNPTGSAFQQKVYHALLDIPYGQTRSYQEIAQAIGHPKAMRAVGTANRKNPLPLFIPCHRVIGAKGDLAGYAFGLQIKKFLLDLERKNVE